MSPEISFARAVVDAPYRFKIKVENPEALPEELKGRSEVCFELKSPCMGSLFKISEIFLSIDQKDIDALDQDLGLGACLKLVHEHTEKVLRIISILLDGKPKDPPGWLMEFLQSNLKGKEVLELFTEALLRIDVTFFLSSLRGLKNINLIEKETTP